VCAARLSATRVRKRLMPCERLLFDAKSASCTRQLLYALFMCREPPQAPCACEPAVALKVESPAADLVPAVARLTVTWQEVQSLSFKMAVFQLVSSALHSLLLWFV
jgi:hypothetical protein